MFLLTTTLVLSLTVISHVNWVESQTRRPVCPLIFIQCLEPCKYVKNYRGCTACACPPDCRATSCSPGQECRNSCPNTIGCEKYQCFSRCNPVTCTNKCPSGYWYDANGCQTCRCKNACDNVACPINQVCVPKNTTNPLAGYDCVAQQLCCPRPIPPTNNCSTVQTQCSNCLQVCNLMCINGFKCCPDWFGCKRCIKAVAC